MDCKLRKFCPVMFSMFTVHLALSLLTTHFVCKRCWIKTRLGLCVYVRTSLGIVFHLKWGKNLIQEGARWAGRIHYECVTYLRYIVIKNVETPASWDNIMYHFITGYSSLTENRRVGMEFLLYVRGYCKIRVGQDRGDHLDRVLNMHWPT